jgi:hypothetical protein
MSAREKRESAPEGRLAATSTPAAQASSTQGSAALGHGYGSRLLDQHAAKLAASAVSVAVAADRGYVSAERKAEMERHGFPAAQRRAPALVIPLHDVYGEVAGHQMRADDPRLLNGKPAKYETAAGGRALLDVPPRVRPMLGDPAVPLVVTEGPIKADAAASAGLAAVALLGVWSWRGRNEDGGKVALPDWEHVALNGRRVVLAFDSDVMLKASVYEALRRLAAFLDRRRAEVGFLYLPTGPHGEKVGLDDWFAEGHAAAELWPMVTADLRPPPALVADEAVEPPPDYSAVPAESGAELLDALAGILRRYVAFSRPEHADAVALWVLHTWAIDAAESTPRLAVLSPEKGSGKTRTLEVLDLLARRPLMVANATPAAIFRSNAASPRTLLFDEADATFGAKAGPHEDLRALVNAGHRRGSTVIRCVGDGASMEVVEFDAYAPVALAGLGDLPDTILDRSVIIRMRRRRPDEPVAAMRERTARVEAAPLAEIDPEMPEGVTDRPADVWAPLVAIADAAGGDWPARARAAAVVMLADASDEGVSLGVRLLDDLRAVFAATEKMHTAAILDALLVMEDAPWGDLRGRPLDARGLARLLKRYGVKSRDVRLDSVAKGYQAADLADAWARYLPPPSVSSRGATSATSATSATRNMSATGNVPPTSGVAGVAAVAHMGDQGSGVADSERYSRQRVAL